MTINTLSAYIPMDRRHALARGMTLPDYAHGAALFADVAGFTPMAEALARQLGPRRGAEELTVQLNRVYGALIEAVHSYGGSVVSFSGDAITCWFDEQEMADGGWGVGDAPSPNSHPSSTLRAIACALQMQRAMRELTMLATPASAQTALVVKVAVAGGPAHRFLVGDPQIHVLDVLAGRTLDALAAAEHMAVSGEVVLEEQTALQIEADVRVASWRTDAETGRRVAVVGGLALSVPRAPWPPLAAQSLIDAQLRPWLLPDIYLRLRDGHDQFLAELRPAVALMLQFGGIDYDRDAMAGARLDAFIRWVQHVAARYEGHLLDIIIGDKGSYLYVAFGAPIAHDDDAARAVAAALELHTPAPTIVGVTNVRIGIASGQMRCGAYGAIGRHTYGVIGDRTNLAARLMEGAKPGQIVCDDTTYQRARGRWEFAELPAVLVKGKTGLFRVYQPSGAPSHHGETARDAIIGRQQEIAYLRECLEAIAAGASRILVLEGEPGIGKSRLIAELQHLCQERGFTGLIGSAQHIEQAPYRHWHSIFTSCFGLNDVTDPLERQARVQAQVAELVPDLGAQAPLLNDVLNLDLPETAQTRALDIAQRGERLSELLVALLRAWAAVQPLVLVLEDAHHLDTLSSALARRVAQALPSAGLPLFLVIVLRPLALQHPAMAQLITLLGLPGARHIRVPRLSLDEIGTLAAARLGVAIADLPSPIAKLVQNRADGNPLFAEELIAALRGEGLVRVEATAEEAGPGRLRGVVGSDLSRIEQVLPDTLQGVILSRIDRLTPAEQLTLKVASVIGSTFEFPPLHHTRSCQATIDEPALKHQLRALSAQDFTWLETPEPHLAYRFKHILVQEVAYQSLLYAQRRELHRIVAGWYEATNGGAEFSVLNSELSNASTQNHALESSEGPTHNTRDTGLAPYVGLLAYHYRQAEDAARERRYVAMLGEQLFNASAFREAITCFERSLSLTPDGQAHQSQRARLTAWLARSYALLGEPGQAQRLYQESLMLAETAEDYAGAASACYELGSLAYRRTAHAEALSYLERSLELYRVAHDRAGEGRVLDRLGGLYIELGEEAKALEFYQQAIALGRIGQRRNHHKA